MPKACSALNETGRNSFYYQEKHRPYLSKEKLVQLNNLLKRDFSTQTINEKRVADITYIPMVRDGWCYLASVLDLHSKKVVCYSFFCSMTSELVIEALQNAYTAQKPREGLIIHTDLGSQYTDYSTAKVAIFQFIEGWYNRNRIHSRSAINPLKRLGIK